jgi:hypothetical protein
MVDVAGADLQEHRRHDDGERQTEKGVYHPSEGIG